jgi:hypothetical protein
MRIITCLCTIITCQGAELADLQQLTTPPTVVVEYKCLIAKDLTVDNTFISQYNLSHSNIHAEATFLTSLTIVQTQQFILDYNQVFKFDPGYVSIGAGGCGMHKRYDEYDSKIVPLVTASGALATNNEAINGYCLADATYLFDDSFSANFSIGFHTDRHWFLGIVQHYEHINVHSPRYYEQTYMSAQTGVQFAYVGHRMDWTLQLTTQAFTWAIGVNF